MGTIIVYVDDAGYALPLLQAAASAPQAGQTQWVLVACAPRITHRVSKFASNRSRESWRNKWAERLFLECVPVLDVHGNSAQVRAVLARSPLPELLETLQAEHGGQAQVVDMRRPKQPKATPHAPLHKLAGVLTSIGGLWTVVMGEALAA